MVVLTNETRLGIRITGKHVNFCYLLLYGHCGKLFFGTSGLQFY